MSPVVLDPPHIAVYKLWRLLVHDTNIIDDVSRAWRLYNTEISNQRQKFGAAGLLRRQFFHELGSKLAWLPPSRRAVGVKFPRDGFNL